MIDSFRVTDNLLSAQCIGRECHHSLSARADSYYVKRQWVSDNIMENSIRLGKRNLRCEQGLISAFVAQEVGREIRADVEIDVQSQKGDRK
jgi:hypothetical protein